MLCVDASARYSQQTVARTLLKFICATLRLCILSVCDFFNKTFSHSLDTSLSSFPLSLTFISPSRPNQLQWTGKLCDVSDTNVSGVFKRPTHNTAQTVHCATSQIHISLLFSVSVSVTALALDSFARIDEYVDKWIDEWKIHSHI